MRENPTMSRRYFLLLTGGTNYSATLPYNMVGSSDRRQSAIKFMESTCGKDGKIPGKILIAYSSRCGSTGEVSEAIGQTLCGMGVSTEVRLAENVDVLSPYHAIILGSAVRAGKLLPEAVAFVKRHHDKLSRIPLANFIVCMAMKDDTTENRCTASAYLDPLYKLAPQVKPVDTGLFAGVTDFRKLSFINRSILKGKGIPEGDFRNWEAIRSWAVRVRSLLLA